MHQEAVAQFVAATQASPQTAARYLAQADYDVRKALAAYRRQHSGARRVVTLNDLDEDAPGQPVQFFTGGEHSALAVTNPNEGGPQGSDLINSILRKAQNAQPSAEAEPVSAFNSRGSRLGNGQDDAEEEASSEGSEDGSQLPIAKPTLHFWRNGFSIDDGRLYSFDDPDNAVYLRAINQGRAPIGLLNVAHNQSVDVRVDNRPNEDYAPPRRPASLSDAGEGRVLGSWVEPVQAAAAAPEEAAPEAAAPREEADRFHSGDAAVQIRLADGTAHRLRLDSDGSVQQMYDFVDQHYPGVAYTLQTQFPPKRLDDRSLSLKQANVVNSVVVQRLV